ncbi:hypothetical protein HRbin14_02126 [bacterium HR14]|nr:hypothetical protein HRbin14_02126 [bacterium HR14]
MADAQRPLQVLLLQGAFQGGKLPRALHHPKPFRRPHRHPGGVVSPVLQPPKAIYEHIRGVPKTDIAYDPTHIPSLGVARPLATQNLPSFRPAPRLSLKRAFPWGFSQAGGAGTPRAASADSSTFPGLGRLSPFSGSATSSGLFGPLRFPPSSCLWLAGFLLPPTPLLRRSIAKP